MSDDRARGLLARLTVQQKVALVCGTGMSRDFLGWGGRVPGAAGATLELPELGLPESVHADGPAGVRIAPTRDGDDRTFYATAFPVATALSCSWDVELLESVGRAMGEEALEYGVDFLLGPAMNIHRNPLTGRNFEYLSEDPLLSGRAAAALVRGIQSTGVAATIKHFAANNTETSRFVLDTVVSARALREIYLRGFEIAISEASPGAVMSAYNRINGQYASQSVDLLETILREDWGFEGIVMTDWFSGDSAVEQVVAGNDLLMPGTQGQLDELNGEIGRSLPMEALDRNVLRIIESVLATPFARGHNASEAPDLPAHAAVARRAGAEGTVLLANRDATLPLSPDDQRIAAFGNTSYDLISGGTGSGDVNEAYTVSLVEGLRAAGLDVDAEVEARYLAHLESERERIPERPWFLPQERPVELGLDQSLIEAKADESDTALITIGRLSGEFEDRKLDDDFLLADTEVDLIDRVSRAFHAVGKKVVVVLNIGNVIEMASWRDRVDAIVVPWQGGQEAGHAIADVLTGKTNPSGRLVTTIPIRYEDLAAARNFPGVESGEEVDQGWVPLPKGRPAVITYEEGIYVGYRYMDAFGVDPAYAFGFGLSYTTFEYRNASSPDAFAGDEIEVTVEIENVGETAGREVVQLYLAAPDGTLDKPPVELRGFGKTAELVPGQKEIVRLIVDRRSLMSFDESKNAWVADPGTYTVHLGSSSRDLHAMVTFELDHPFEMTVRPALPLRQPLEEIRP